MAGGRDGHGLRNYLIRRFLLMVPTLLGVTLAVFALVQFVPGGPMDQVLMQAAGSQAGGEAGSGAARTTGRSNISQEHLRSLEEYYGFDKSPLVRYGEYLANLATLDLGTSFRYTMPVIDVIKLRLPVSLYYGLITTILTYTLCIPLGMVKAIRHKTWLDNLSSVLIFIGYAIPHFALGAVLLALFAVKFGWFPLGGFKSSEFADLSFTGKALDLIHHSILPLICYLIGSFAFMTMLMKNSLMENMSADYVKTALASGLSWRRAVFVHALRNSLIPLATTFGHNVSLILTGSLLIERVFNIQGMGLLFFESIQARDYPVVMGITVIGALLLLIGNLLSDICVALVDPRVRFQ
jgi:microcin C transport system permease protein